MCHIKDGINGKVSRQIATKEQRKFINFLKLHPLKYQESTDNIQKKKKKKVYLYTSWSNCLCQTCADKHQASLFLISLFETFLLSLLVITNLHSNKLVEWKQKST